MGKNRPDGYYIKDINPMTKLMPHIMPKRYDAMNSTVIDVDCGPIDRFIKEQAAVGKNYTYNEIILASIVRLLAERPALNRFVVNRKIYQHNDITICFTVKKALRDDSEETVVKLHFNGTETIDEVSEVAKKLIAENTGEKAYSSVDSTAKFLTSAPHWLIKMLVGILKSMDKHNIMPKSIVEVSPFHNSVFVTFLNSIKGDWVFHHCYDFGTTGLFVSVGKSKVVPVVEGGEIKSKRIFQMGFVMDERFCDGLYYLNSLRAWQKIFKNPACLLEHFDATDKNIVNYAVRTKEDKQKFKKLAKQKKREAKAEKKLLKKQKNNKDAN